jgi:hypothetical protein
LRGLGSTRPLLHLSAGWSQNFSGRRFSVIWPVMGMVRVMVLQHNRLNQS